MSGSTSSDKGKKKVVEEESNQEDRLSALPDALIDHIFSFLNMRVVVQTCILSSKWRYLWLSTSNLNFDNDEVISDSPGCCKCSVECKCESCVEKRAGILDNDAVFFGELISDSSGCCKCSLVCKCESCDKKRAGFTNFVGRVLFLITNSNIVNFNLISTCWWLDPDHVCSWINTALGLKSQNIVLEITPHKPLEIPACLFTSNVEELTLSCYSMLAQSRLPTTMSKAAQLKNMELNCLLFPDGNAEGELILSFSVLENLAFWNCNVTHLKIISIAAPLLKSLDVAHIYTKENYSCKVKMCAPNLKSVKLATDVEMRSSPVEYCMENPSSLISADISICSYDGKDSARACVKCWTKVMSWTYNVQILKLVTSSVQTLVGSPQLLERLPEVFHNLKHVTLSENWKTSFGAVLNFLERVPSVKTLILEREYHYCKVGEEWTVNLPLQKIFTCMDTFEFRNFLGLEIEMEFLELLLERAVTLKKMIIKTVGLQAEHQKKILSLPRASSSTSIIFSVMVRR